jgi:hypothetical protein
LQWWADSATAHFPTHLLYCAVQRKIQALLLLTLSNGCAIMQPLNKYLDDVSGMALETIITFLSPLR